MENQNTEWKEKWRDEYLEWVCGFANAQGGVIEIGRNDSGILVGLSGAAKLLEVLPNKIRTTMGIVADVKRYLTIGFIYSTPRDFPPESQRTTYAAPTNQRPITR